jgi:hypothetical protein
MPYMRHNTPSVRPLPRRSRGMGQSACNWLTNVFCSGGALETAFGVPCSTCPVNQPLQPPTITNQPGPTLPVGYNPDTGTISSGSGNTTGQTGAVLPTYTLPNVPGYDNSNNGGGGGGGATPSCDWTQASWTDITTWCGTNWLLAGIAVIGGAIMLRQALR